MKQGTVSVLFGCHNILHSIFVLIAYIKLYRKLPSWWKFICIIIHDIGHWGKQYLDNIEEKRDHWRTGAQWGKKMFGRKGFMFIAGHTRQSGYPLSELHKADKYSWYITPAWIIWLNAIFEPKLTMGYGRWDAVKKFKNQVKKTIESGEYGSVHQMYIDRCKNINQSLKS